MLTLIIVILVYLSVAFILTYQLYNCLLKYWKSKIVSLKKEEDYNDINIHDLYPEFNRVDKLSFIRLYLGVVFLVPVRVILFLLTIITFMIILKVTLLFKKTKLNFLTRYYAIFALYIVGIFPSYKKVFPKEIYERWLGKEYDLNQNEFAFIVSNHISSFEAWYLIYKYSSTFIAKKTIETLIFFGEIAKNRNCIFVDRTDSNNRRELAFEIKRRGEDYIKNKDDNNPLSIFAEGTTTNGEYLIKFRKGAFTPMLPLKPVIFKFPFNSIFQNSATMGVMPNLLWLVYSFTSIYHRMEIIELPIIKPNDYMISNYLNNITKSINYDNINKDIFLKYNSKDISLINESTPLNNSIKSSNSEISTDQIYADVVRNIMAEVNNFKKSEKSFQEMLNYVSTVRGYTIKNT